MKNDKSESNIPITKNKQYKERNKTRRDKIYEKLRVIVLENNTTNETG